MATTGTVPVSIHVSYVYVKIEGLIRKGWYLYPVKDNTVTDHPYASIP